MNFNINQNKQVFIHKAGYLFIARLLPILVLFVITVLFARKLSYNEYGTFQSVWMYSNIINVIITFGFTSIILSTNESLLNSFIINNRQQIIFFYSLLTILTLFVFYSYARNLTLSTILLLIAFTLTQNIIAIKEIYLIKYERQQQLFYINIFYTLFFLLWHFYILFQGYDLNKLIIGIIILSIIKIFAIRSHRTLLSNQNNLNLSHASFKNHWIFIGINDIIGVFSKWIDKLFLLYLLTPSDFAVFFNGSFEIPLFGLLITVAGNLLMVDISKGLLSSENVLKSFDTNYKLLSAIVFPIFFFLLFYNKELFALLFNHKYDASIPVFIISLFILPLRINNYGALLQCYSRGDLVMKGSILDISIVIILMLALYTDLSTKGVAVAVVFGTYAQIFYYLLSASKAINVRFLALFPLKYLSIYFFIILIIYTSFHFIYFGNDIYIRLLIGGSITIFTIIAGLIKFNRNNIKNFNGNNS